MTEITEAGLAIAAQPATRPGLQREIAGIIIRDVLQEDQDDLVEGYFDEIMQAAKRIALLPAYNVVARAFETNAAEHMLKAAAECTRLQEELTRLQAEVEGLRDVLRPILRLRIAIAGAITEEPGAHRIRLEDGSFVEGPAADWLLETSKTFLAVTDAVQLTLQGQQS